MQSKYLQLLAICKELYIKERRKYARRQRKNSQELSLTISIFLEITDEGESAELVHITILDVDTGEELLDCCVRPYCNDIGNDDDGKYIFEVMPQINEIIAFAKGVVIYGNNSFQVFNKFKPVVLGEPFLYDMKDIFSVIYGEVQYDSRGYMFFAEQNLDVCAEYFGYDWEGHPHNGLNACRAIAFCFKKAKQECWCKYDRNSELQVIQNQEQWFRIMCPSDDSDMARQV